MSEDKQYTIEDFKQYMETLKRTAYSLLRGNDSPSLRPSDLVQEALLKKPDQTWKDEQHFLNDTRKKMKQALLDHIRRKKAIRRQPSDSEASEPHGIHDRSPSAQKGFDDLNEKLHSLQFLLFSGSQSPDISKLVLEWPDQLETFLDNLSKLETLRPEWAEAVELRLFAGLTIEQIAGVTKRSEKTIRNHWALAKAVLQEET